MTVLELAAAGGFEIINAPKDTSVTVKGVYACDLLSWVIGRAPQEAALVTVMTNVNVIAVAVMADLSCVILSENVMLDEMAKQKAIENGVAVLRSTSGTYETCCKLATLLGEK